MVAMLECDDGKNLNGIGRNSHSQQDCRPAAADLGALVVLLLCKVKCCPA
jgi:hypothetical protein